MKIRNNSKRYRGLLQQEYQNIKMAERVGFEPTLPIKVNALSRRALSTTQPPLREWEQSLRQESTRSKLFLFLNQNLIHHPKNRS